MISIFSSGCCRIISTLSICTNVNTIDNHSSGSHVAVEFIKQSYDCSYIKVQNWLMDIMTVTVTVMLMVMLMVMVMIMVMVMVMVIIIISGNAAALPCRRC